MSSSSAIAVGARDSSQERDADVRAAKALGKTESFLDAPTTSRGASPCEQGGEAPESVSRTLGGGGARLSPEQSEDYGAAFGADFSDVRIHSGDEAERSAREVGAPAYSVGRDVVMTGGLESPSSPEGRKVLGHELAHVAQSQQEPGPPVLRRVGFFESVARFFGGGTFEKGELITYLNWLEDSPKEFEGHNDSDNKARAVVTQGLHKARSVRVRQKLIKELLDGYVAGDDQVAIVTILEDAAASDRFEILKGDMAVRIEKELGGSALKRFYALVEKVEAGKPYPVPTAWLFEYQVTGASEIRGKTGIVVDSLRVRPTGQGDSIPIAAGENAVLAGSEAKLMRGKLDHPRDKGGVGFLDYRVGVADRTGALTPLPGASEQMNAKYDPITNDVGSVIAHLDVKMEDQKTGEHTEKHGVSIADHKGKETEKKKGTTVTDTNEKETGKTAGQKKTSDQRKTVGKGTTVGEEQEKNKEESDAKKKEREKSEKDIEQKSKEKSSSKTTGEEDSTYDFDGKLEGKFKAEIEAEVSQGKTWKKITKWGLKKLLEYIPDKRAKLLLPLVELIDTDETVISIDASGNFSLKGKLHGEASRKWKESTEGAKDTKVEGKEKGTVARESDEKKSTVGEKDIKKKERRADESASQGTGQEDWEEATTKNRVGRAVAKHEEEVERLSTGQTTTTSDETSKTTYDVRPVIKEKECSLNFNLVPPAGPAKDADKPPPDKPKAEEKGKADTEGAK
jgi:hypothetical protein